MNGYKESLRQYFSVQAKALRKKRKLTQEEMSEQLHITVRAYGDLERGCSCCSAIALLFFLLMLEPDELTAFLAQMKSSSGSRISRRSHRSLFCSISVSENMGGI